MVVTMNDSSYDTVTVTAHPERITAGGTVQLIAEPPATGTFDGQAFIAPMRPGNLEVHWPEGLSLLDAELVDPESGEPDYTAVVRLEVLDAATPTG